MPRFLGLVGCVCFGLSFSAWRVSAEPPPDEPTPEQVEKIRQSFGAKYQTETDSNNKNTIHFFTMPRKTTDADLKKLHNVPFRLGLDLAFTEVTDAGLKELKDLKQLTELNLTDCCAKR